MKVLLAFRHRKAVEPFVELIERLGDRGHEVVVGAHERDEKIAALFASTERLAFVTLPDGRRDGWNETADLARHVRDLLRYLHEPYRDASKLRGRVFERLLKRIGVPAEVGARWSADPLMAAGPAAVELVERALAQLERAVPPDEISVEALRRLSPDVVVATPLVHFGSTQVELVKAARALSIPVGMLLFSWDNLSTKGALHVAPDHLFVWNEQQQREAESLHDFPANRITITGAPRFDRFFQLSSRVDRGAFCGSLGVPTDTPVILYVCSSRLVAEKEVKFLREWVGAVRNSGNRVLRDAMLVVRPHPDLPLTEGKWLSDERTFRWNGLGEAELHARTLFGDPRAVVLSSDYSASQVLYECIYHSRAVVGLNTSAEIEAGIVGRPVFTVLTAPHYADGQHTTLHFHYLLEKNGGFVQEAASLADHVRNLAGAVEAPQSPEMWRHRVAAFVRPAGWSRAASDVAVEAIERELPTASTRAPRQDSIVYPQVATVQGEAPGLRKLGAIDSTRVRRIPGSPIELWALDEGEHLQEMRSTSREALEWIAQHVGPGDVLYDLNAGGGHLAVAAARSLGCTVFAFESSLPALAHLWTMVLLNGVDGLVAPLPLRAGPRTVLGLERYEVFGADAARLPVRTPIWREHDTLPGREVRQPVLSAPLDWAMKRWRLPAPHALRAVVGADVRDVFAAIKAILPEPSLRVIVLEGPGDHLDAAAELLHGVGWHCTRALGADGIASFIRREAGSDEELTRRDSRAKARLQ